MKAQLLLLFAFLGILMQTNGTVVQKRVWVNPLTKTLWHPITKFVMGYGKGHYKLKVWNEVQSKENGTLNLNLLVYTYDAWLKQMDKAGCSKKEAESVYKQEVSVPRNGDEFATKEISLGQDTDVQVWYFALANCDEDNELYDFMVKNRIKYEFTIINSNGSHISEEENGVMTVLVITLIFIFGFFASHAMKLHGFYTHKSALDYPLVILVFALMLEFLALFNELLHLYFFSLDGQGFFMCDWLNFVFANLSQLVISILFLLMAFGWTVRNLSKDDEEVFVIVTTVGALLTIFLTIVSKVSTNNFDSFHDYGNWFGVVTLITKLVIYAIFVFMLMKSYSKCEDKLKDHFKKLGIFGSIYLLSLPVSVIVIDILLPPYYRHKAITYSLIIVQSATLIIYASLLSFKDGSYYPIVLKNRSILPTNKVI